MSTANNGVPRKLHLVDGSKDADLGRPGLGLAQKDGLGKVEFASDFLHLRGGEVYIVDVDDGELVAGVPLVGKDIDGHCVVSMRDHGF